MIETENACIPAVPQPQPMGVPLDNSDTDCHAGNEWNEWYRQAARQIADMIPKLADKLARMEIVNPEVLRVTPAFRTFEQCAVAFRGGHKDLFGKSQSEKITTFWSHSWHGGCWKKIITLMFICNGPAAIFCGSISALLAMLLFHFGVLPGFDRGWPGQEILFSCWALGSGALVTSFVTFFWRPQTRVFFDRICIHQNDQVLKAQSILSLAGILKKSDSMLILWDPSWTERLWCLFELAAFLKSKEGDRKRRLIIRPIFLGPISIAIFMSVTVGMIPFQVVPGNENPSAVFIALAVVSGDVVAYIAISTLRNYFRDLDVMKQQLLSISLDATKSECCDMQHLNESGEPIICDRMVVKTCVDIWFGSQAAFENTVRSEILDILVRDLNESVFTTPWSLAVHLPGTWAFMDLFMAFVRAPEVWYQHPTFWSLGLRATLAVWLLAVTFFKDLVVPLCRLTRARPTKRIIEIGKNIVVLFILNVCALFFVLTCFEIAGWIENRLARSSALLVSMLLCALCALISGKGIKFLVKRGSASRFGVDGDGLGETQGRT